MEIIKKAFDCLLTPIKSYPISFLFFALALFLPTFLEYKPQWFANNLSIANYLFLLCIDVSYILVLFIFLISKLSNIGSKILLVLLHLFIYVLIISDIFLLYFFGTHINFFILQLVSETNIQEVSDFLRTYLQPSIVAKIIVGILFIVAIELLLSKRLFKWLRSPKWGSALGNYIFGFYLFFCLGFFFYIRLSYSLNWTTKIEEQKILEYGPNYSFFYKINEAVKQYIDLYYSFEKCARVQELVTSVKGTSTIKDIVVIIGESFNRHHSSLYGYNHNTNPRLSQLNHLYVFDDVISPRNLTTSSFKLFLSLSSEDDSLEWCDKPFFTTIFKKAGYNVPFYSNQYVKDAKQHPVNAPAGFFYHPKIEPFLFSHKNNKRYEYDDGLIDEYKQNRHELEVENQNLIIFHLMGQHFHSYNRFPKERDYFKVDDYIRPELSTEQVQEVADYDNATLYNDSIVNEIISFYQDKDAIILYFADHGDEANDYRVHIGRESNPIAEGAPGLHCQFDIPFLIYLTDTCCILHPELEHKIAQSIHRPFMIDDLPHLLLDIAGIQVPWFDSTRSLINDKYNVHRRRMVNGFVNSTPIDYDSICNAFGEWTIGFTKNGLQ